MLWKELIEKESPELAKCLSLKRVKISKGSGDMVISLNANRLISHAEFKTTKRIFAAAFPGAKVDIKVLYPELGMEAGQSTELLAQAVRDMIIKKIPVATVLDWTGGTWRRDGNVITIPVASDNVVRLLKGRNVGASIKIALKTLFGIDLDVEFYSECDDNERLEQIAEARRKDLEVIALAAANEAKKREGNRNRTTNASIYGRAISDHSIAMEMLAEDSGRVVLTGECTAFESRDTKNGQTKIITFSMTDYTGSVDCKLFLSSRRQDEGSSITAQYEALSEGLKPGKWITVRGTYRYDDYKREMLLIVEDIVAAEKPVRTDNAKDKRVELHLHTNMSTMDATASATELINQAADWGHRAIAITDHGVVQAFPEAFSAAKKRGIKLIPDRAWKDIL